MPDPGGSGPIAHFGKGFLGHPEESKTVSGRCELRNGLVICGRDRFERIFDRAGGRGRLRQFPEAINIGPEMHLDAMLLRVSPQKTLSRNVL